MLIDELMIDNFGKLNNTDIKLEPGFNVIYGENESGKSTAFGFIKAMLFGVNRSRSRNIAADEYTFYEPWVNKNFYEGKMRIKTGGTTYRIERVFSKNGREFHLIDEEEGKEIYPDGALYKKIIQELSEDTFSNTLWISQNKYNIGDGLVGEIKNYVSNINGSKAMDMDVKKAISELKKEKKVFEKKIAALEIARTEDELQRYGALDVSIIKLKNQLKDIENQAKEYGITFEEKIAEPKKEPEEKKEEKEEPFDSTTKAWIIVAFIWFLSIIFMFFAGVGVGLVTGILTSFAFMIYRILPQFRKEEEKEEEKPEEPKYDEATVENKRREYTRARDKINWSLDALYDKRNNYLELKERYEKLKRKKAQYNEEIRAINVAIKTIEELSNDIQSDFGSDINELASEYISYFTGGKYSNITVDEEFNVFLNERDKLIKIEQLSSGTARQVYLAVRLAVARVLFNEEKMPIFLDESFAMYDDTRLTNTLRGLMRISASQVVIFTCVKREMHILDELGIRYNKIVLR